MQYAHNNITVHHNAANSFGLIEEMDIRPEDKDSKAGFHIEKIVHHLVACSGMWADLAGVIFVLRVQTWLAWMTLHILY